MSAGEIVQALASPPEVLREAVPNLPNTDGFYAWWVAPGALPGVPNRPHPTEPWDLLYVGIAPGRPRSRATISSRVAGNHISGNTASSTFRLGLASLLFEREGWQPHRRAKKVVLSREDNAALSRWQAENAALTWAVHPEPWTGTIEDEVIALLEPPMNRAGNAAHPFYVDMGEARRRFREAAA